MPNPLSIVLPGLTARDLMSFLQQRSSIGETSVVRRFRQWVQQQFPGTDLP